MSEKEPRHVTLAREFRAKVLDEIAEIAEGTAIGFDAKAFESDDETWVAECRAAQSAMWNFADRLRRMKGEGQ